MRFAFTADLHIGKKLLDYSLLEDQKLLLQEMVQIVKEAQVAALVIAGDIYDRGVPAEEAVPVLDDFFTQLADAGIAVLAITGNHDSAKRMQFGARLLKKNHLHLVSGYTQPALEPVTFNDEYGKVNFYLLPCVRPGMVDYVFHGTPTDDNTAERITTFQGAMDKIVQAQVLDPAARNILVTHQFVVDDGEESAFDSNQGSLSPIKASTFAPFDYVALGHIHRRYDVVKNKIAYAGSPMKYKVTDQGKERYLSIVELGAKGDITVTKKQLHPLHDLRVIEGAFQELHQSSCFTEDYVEIHLTDQDAIPHVMEQLKAVYPNITGVRFISLNKEDNSSKLADLQLEEKGKLELIQEFFDRYGRGRQLNTEQLQYLEKTIQSLQQEAEVKNVEEG